MLLLGCYREKKGCSQVVLRRPGVLFVILSNQPGPSVLGPELGYIWALLSWGLIAEVTSVVLEDFQPTLGVVVLWVHVVPISHVSGVSAQHFSSFFPLWYVFIFLNVFLVCALYVKDAIFIELVNLWFLNWFYVLYYIGLLQKFVKLAR